jgi:hypothetical protein
MQNDYEILLQKLNSFIKEYYKNLIFRGIIYALIALFSVLIVFAIIEHFGFLNTLARTMLFWTYCSITILIIIKLIIIPAIKMLQLTNSLTHEQAAKIIGQHFEEVSDKLINILELHDIQDGNNAIIEASINQKIKKIQLTPFNKAINWKKTFYYSRFILIPIGVILLFFISGNKRVISDSTLRIINYNQEFEKPAPFYFNIASDSLVGVEKESITVNVILSGDERPNEVVVHYNKKMKKMKKISASEYAYTFQGLQENTPFYLSANEEYSRQYEITILERPEIKNFNISVKPPKHTRIKKELLQNIGSISVPEGTILTWEFETQNTTELKFRMNKNNLTVNPYSDNRFKITQTINSDSEYAISLANSKISFIDTVYYDIKIILDSHPFITIKNIEEESSVSLVNGLIRDDYGFLDLQFNSNIYGLDRDTNFIESIEIDPFVRSQPFIYSLQKVKSQALPGETISCYFTVRDNDKKNGYKSMTSEIININIATYDEVKDDYSENNEIVKSNISAEISMLQKLKEELTEFEMSLIEKDSLDWRDRKKLEEILTKQKKVEETIKNMQNAAKDNFEKMNAMSNPTEEMLKKQNELEKLFNQIMPEEMKELYQELNELREELNKNELQEKLKELQLSNEDLEKELDRNLEILKQVEFEQQLDDVINQLGKLSKNQIDLSKKENELTEQIADQQNQIEKFKNIQKEIEKLKELNKELENKHDISETKTKEASIQEELKKAEEHLKKSNKKRANKSQQEAGEQLEELANFFTNMKKENEKNKNYEDMDVLREILENLVYFSIEEENILLKFQDLDKDDPQYVELMHEQQGLRDAAEIIEDSLFALSKRVPQISSQINREINTIDRKATSSIDHLRERETSKAVQDQQFIMTSANNLAVLLSGILENMQQEMANDLPSQQQCEKPGKGSPKPGDLKKMQQELSDHLKKMKKEMEEGKKGKPQNNGMSKQLVDMLAKQELIRQSLQELRKEMDDKEGLKSLENAIEKMEANEEDIANKKITMESLMRQKEIITRLLEVENAMRNQDEDEERESKTGNNEYERIIQEAYEKYELEKLKQREMIKTTPPMLNNYYKEKVDRYFNLMLQ